MSVAFAAERGLLAADEVEQIERSHYPLLEIVERDDLISLAKWLRARRDRARDLLQDRRRVRRGKGEVRVVAAETSGDRGLAAKKQVYAGALKRVNSRLAALRAEAKREATLARMRDVLARKQSAAARHPGGGATAGGGMRAAANRKPRKTINPGRIGSTSQAGRNAQARRDARA
jgi:hypothetical protein